MKRGTPLQQRLEYQTKRTKQTSHEDAKLAACVANNARAARKRGIQRWHALLKQIGTNNGLEYALGPVPWNDFIEYATRTSKDEFLRRFQAIDGKMYCSGTVDGKCCPRRICASDMDSDFLETLSGLHLDHATDVNHICSVWKDILQPHVASWSDGLDVGRLMQLLFGSNVQLRCAPPKGSKRNSSIEYCHDTRCAHYSNTISARDLRCAT